MSGLTSCKSGLELSDSGLKLVDRVVQDFLDLVCHCCEFFLVNPGSEDLKSAQLREINYRVCEGLEEVLAIAVHKIVKINGVDEDQLSTMKLARVTSAQL